MKAEKREGIVVGTSLFAKGPQSQVEFNNGSSSHNTERVWINGEYKIGTKVAITLEVEND